MDNAKRIFKATLAILIATAGLMGCAHSHTRGSVAMKHGDQEADVCIGGKEIKPGDKVTLFKSECTGVNSKETQATCQKVRLGEGEVLSVLDEHYSTIRVNSGVTFSIGAIVEKQ